MEVTLRNVEVRISAVPSPEQAYDRLCAALAALESDGTTRVSWDTSEATYESWDGNMRRVGRVADLWPTEADDDATASAD